MGTDTDSIVYFIKRNETFAAGYVKYGSGEFYSDELGFITSAATQSGSLRQLADWMEQMEAEGYSFQSTEEAIDGD